MHISLLLSVATSAAAGKAPSNLLFYTCATKEVANQCDESFSLDQRGVANRGFSANTTTIAAGFAAGITTLFSTHDTFFRNGAGLRPDWKEAWAAVQLEIDSLVRSGAIVGFFAGDELVSGGKITRAELLTCLDTLAVAKATYKQQGITLFTWANEGGEVWVEQFNASGIPASLDVVSIDDYYMDAKGTPESQVQGHRQWYENTLYPLLNAEQRVFVVPGSFATRNANGPTTGRYANGNATFCYRDAATGAVTPATCDAYMADQANAFATWAWDDARVVGFAPWHWDTRGIADVSPYKEIGVVDMPRTKAAWKKIGARVRRAAAATGPSASQ